MSDAPAPEAPIAPIPRRVPSLRRRRRRRGPYASAFVRLEKWVLDTPAYKTLSGGALKVLIAIWHRHNGNNNGQIPFSVREAEAAVPCAQNTARKFFAELQAKGWIRLRRASAFSVK